MNLNLTNTGLRLLVRALGGGATIRFTHVALGSGADAGESASALTHQEVLLPITSSTRGQQTVNLKVGYNNSDVQTGFRLTELGIYAEDPDSGTAELLYAYGYSPQAEADYVPTAVDRTLETEMTIAVYVGAAENVMVQMDGGAYALASDLVAHIRDAGNPHRIDPAQIGAATAAALEEVKHSVSNPFVVAARGQDMVDTSRAYVYAGDGSGADAGLEHGAWYYWDGAAWIRGGISVDDTLTLPGVAADAEVTGDKISDLQSDLIEYNAFDVLDAKSNATDTTHEGISFDWTGGTCHVHGTSVAQTYSSGYVLRSEESLPDGWVPGKTYFIKYSSSAVSLRIFAVYSGGTSELVKNTYTNTTFVLPDNAIGVSVRLFVATGVTVDEYVSPGILSAESNNNLLNIMNNGLSGRLELSRTESVVLTAETKIDSLSVGSYICQNATVASSLSLPFMAGGRLYVFDSNATNRYLQIFLSYGDSANKQIAIRGYNGSAWSVWHTVENTENMNAAITAMQTAIDNKTVKATNAVVSAANYENYFGDYDNVPINTIYAVNRPPINNAPAGDGVQINADSSKGYINGVLMTFSQSTSASLSYVVQLCVGYYSDTDHSPILAYRMARTVGGVRSWTPWAKVSQDRFLGATNIVLRASTVSQHFTDLDDAPINTIYQIDKDCVDGVLSHHPAPGYSAVLMTYGFSVSTRHGMVQDLYSLQSGIPVKYFRYGYLQDQDDYRWTVWQKVLTESVV